LNGSHTIRSSTPQIIIGEVISKVMFTRLIILRQLIAELKIAVSDKIKTTSPESVYQSKSTLCM